MTGLAGHRVPTTLAPQGLFACVLCAFMVSGCTTQQTAPLNAAPSTHASKPYRYPLAVTAPEPLAQVLPALMQNQTALAPVWQAAGGLPQLTITLQPEVRHTKPRLMGSLRPTELTETFTLTYTLSDTRGRMLTTGTETFQNPPRTVLGPASINPQTMAPDSEALQQASQQMLTKISPFITNTAWQVPVSGRIDVQHVSVPVGPDVGLNVGDVLSTVAHPLAQLQLVTFEELPNGRAQAVLRLELGQLPQPGALLTVGRIR